MTGTKRMKRTAPVVLLLLLAMVASLFVSGTNLSGRAASIATKDVTIKKVSGNWVSVSIKTGKVVNYTGIAKNEYGWWKTTNGKVTFQETGVFQNSYGWWRVVNSKVDFNANSIYKNSHGWWKTTNGKVTFNETGIFQNSYGLWFVQNSKVDFSVNGVVQQGDAIYEVINGKARKMSADETATGTAGYLDTSAAYTALNDFRTSPNVWFWNADNKTKTVYNSNSGNQLGALTRDAELEKTAQVRAKEASQSFSHTRPDGTNCFTAYPQELTVYGENIAYGRFLSATAATELWKESNANYDGQGHRRSMLNKDFNVVGIACYRTADGDCYWVQSFGRR